MKMLSGVSELRYVMLYAKSPIKHYTDAIFILYGTISLFVTIISGVLLSLLPGLRRKTPFEL
jgi:hypothetical protein